MSFLASVVHHARWARSALREAIKGRSPRWRGVRDAYLTAHPNCAACGGAKALQVHHVVPYAVDPERELDPTNLIALCFGPLECHLRIGHGDDFGCYNPRVREQARTFDRYHPDLTWMTAHSGRVPIALAGQ